MQIQLNIFTNDTSAAINEFNEQLQVVLVYDTVVKALNEAGIANDVQVSADFNDEIN